MITQHGERTYSGRSSRPGVCKQKYCSPGAIALHAKYINGNIVITFRYAAGGLRTSDGKAATGFSVSGNTEVKASVEKHRIIIASNEKPVFVYCGWQPFTTANLVNSKGVPASTFKINVL